MDDRIKSILLYSSVAFINVKLGYSEDNCEYIIAKKLPQENNVYFLRVKTSWSDKFYKRNDFEFQTLPDNQSVLRFKWEEQSMITSILWTKQKLSDSLEMIRVNWLVNE